MSKKDLKIYTVTQLNQLIKGVLEENIESRFIVTGELSGFKRYSSGHCYFSLKDSGGVLSCVMWSSSYGRLKFEPKDGMAVFAAGYVDVYVPQGKYQFYAERMEPSGVGALQVAFEQVVVRLEAEGLFDQGHKKPLPAYPMKIGIVTSDMGAAVRDIEESIHSRWPCARLFLYPVAVQGEGAGREIAAALRDINRRNKELGLEVLIVGRGGGSLEDIWAFNEEEVARAIYASKIPIISAVGHEIDTTIADLVADARASTPTKAGVTAVPDIFDILDQLSGFESRMESRVAAAVELGAERVERLLASAVFRNPLGAVMAAAQRVDDLGSELAEGVLENVRRGKDILGKSYMEIAKIEPHRLIGRKMVELESIESGVRSGIERVVNRCRISLTASENRMMGLNPKSVLERGYSITKNKKTGKVVAGLEDVEKGDILISELAKEKLIESQVTKKYN